MGVARATAVGVVNGTVTDAETRSPISDVAVTASASSGTYHATTDSHGFYSITGVYADTYTFSFQHTAYEPVSIPGITVFADQSQQVNTTLTKSLKTIAKVQARNTGGAFQPNQTTDTYNVTSSQITTIQGNALNISETSLITSLPGASSDAFGYPVIHGGRENEEGFQFEGIPYVDAFTNQFTNTLATPGLGLQSVQLTPGAGNATFGNTGTGVLNLVSKRGSYPSYATFQGAAGGPNFFHAFNAEYGTASQNGQWSEYATFAGQDTGYRYGAGRYPAAQILRFGSTLMETDREFVNNFVYRFGHNRNQSMQFFVDLADHHFYQGYGGNPFCFKTCDPVFARQVGAFTGLSPTQLANMMSLDPYQTNPFETLAQAHRPRYTYYQPNEAYKLEYTNNLSSATYLSLRYYRVNAVTTFDFPYASTSPFYPSFVLQQGGFTNGGTLQLTTQLNQKNLLQVGGDYGWLHPVYDQPTNNYGIWDLVFNNQEQYDFVSPTDPNCPLGTDGSGTSYCGYLYKYFPRGVKVPSNEEASITNRQDWSFFINDKIDASSKFKAEVGVRLDAINYKVPAVGIDPSTCTTLYLPTTWTPPTLWNPGAPGSVCDAKATFGVTSDQIRPRVWQPRTGLTYNPTPNDSLRFTYGRSVLFPPLGQIDLYVPPGYYSAFNNVPSFVNGGLLVPAPGATPLPAGTNIGPALCGIPGYQVACASYGDQLRWDASNSLEGVPIQPVKPETFSNIGFTYEHQFSKGFLNGVSFSIAPWYRRGFDAVASTQTPRIGPNGQPVLNPDGSYVLNPPIASNRGTNFASGVDVRITRPAEFGWSGQFSAAYINEFSNVIPLSPLEDFFPTLPPASLALGNLYRVGFLTPLSTSLSLQYRTHNGWRFNPTMTYDIGYPIGAGTVTAAYINGVAYNIPNTNASAAINTAPVGAPSYVDPLNPGSFFHPNIAWTRGTPEAASAGGKLSNPDFYANMTVEYTSPHNFTIGATVQNIFNELYSGSYVWGYNTRFQVVGTGIGGPLTGISSDRNAYRPYGPSYGYVQNYAAYIHGHEPYLNTPENQGRTFYVYLQVKM